MATITVASKAAELAKELDVTEDQYAAREYFALIEKFINRAYKEILAFHPWSWRYISDNFPTVIGQAEYEIPIGTMELRSMALGPPDNVPLFYTTIRDLESRGLDLTERGVPSYVYETGYNETTQVRKVSLYLVPNSISFTVNYNGYLSAMDLASGAIIPIREDMMHLLDYRTKYFMYLDDGDDTNANACKEAFADALKTAKRMDGSKTIDESDRVYVDVPPAPQSFPIRLPGYPRF